MYVQVEHHLTSLEEARQHYEYYKEKLEGLYSTTHSVLPEVEQTEKDLKYWRTEYQFLQDCQKF